MSPKKPTTSSPNKPRASRPLVDKYVHRVRFRALPLFYCGAVGQGIGDLWIGGADGDTLLQCSSICLSGQGRHKVVNKDVCDSR